MLKKNASLNIIKVFFIFFLIGAFLLSLPIARSAPSNSLYNLIKISLFTSMSALSCTGLSIVNITTYYSWFGKLVILLLIQLGGIGIITVFSWIIHSIGMQNSKTEKIVFSEIFELKKESKFSYFLKRVIRYTFTVELVGAIIITLMISHEYGWSSVLIGVFHSISSFCNAGFTIFTGDNLSNYIDQPLFLLITSMLIILGGLGFISLINIRESYAKNKGDVIKTYKRLSAITKMVLQWSLGLIVLGTIGFYYFERLSGNSIGWINAFFLSVSSRTAGFSTFDLKGLNWLSKLLLIVLMFVGGASGSAAGGIHINNITTILYSRFNDKIPRRKVEKAKALIVLTIIMLATITFIFFAFEHFLNLDLLIEIFSAFGTVGLSSIGTQNLSLVSLICLMILMFIGKYSLSMFVYAFYYHMRDGFRN